MICQARTGQRAQALQLYDTLDVGHFDFQFYMVDNDVRLAIDPADRAYQAKAESQPDPAFVPEGYVLPAPLAFPRMGVH
jgi:hypothetical protein